MTSASGPWAFLPAPTDERRIHTMSENSHPPAPAEQPEVIHLTRPWGQMFQYALNTQTSVKIVEV
ncbi:MAG: hypothetical protein EBY11_15560, partial [Proteobacteria bacterium]|nr:hypothetical protein [Pseudomonadota bacterium]